MPWIKQLVGCPLFEGLTEEEISVFRPATRQVEFEAGQNLMSEGDSGDDILILTAGRVTISKQLTLLAEEEQSITDKTFITLDAVNKPFFGEMSLVMENSSRTATVKAETGCSVVVLEKQKFWPVCEQNPHLGMCIMSNIASKLAANLQRENQNVLKLTTAFSLVLKD